MIAATPGARLAKDATNYMPMVPPTGAAATVE